MKLEGGLFIYFFRGPPYSGSFRGPPPVPCAARAPRAGLGTFHLVEVSKEALPRGRHSRPEAIDELAYSLGPSLPRDRPSRSEAVFYRAMGDLFDYGLP
jgi:hypothetical protein